MNKYAYDLTTVNESNRIESSNLVIVRIIYMYDEKRLVSFNQPFLFL